MSDAAFSSTVNLSPNGLSWLKAKLVKWPEVTIRETPQVITDEITGVEHTRFLVEVSLNAPVIPGHKLLARIEHLGDEGNIIYRCAGEEKPAYRTCKPLCQHCNTIRRRNDTFILLEEATGKEKQIGRNCLAEYVRDESAAVRLLDWASCIDRIITCCSDAEENYGTGRAAESYTVPFVLSWALGYGGKWVSGSQAREEGGQATAPYIYGLMTQLAFARRFAEGRRWLETREGQQAEAIDARAKELREDQNSDVYKTIAWIDSLAAKPETAVSDYENNLIVIRRVGFCTPKQWNFVCSAFRAWLRAQHIARGEEEKRAREAAPVTGEYVGAVGERLGFPQANCVFKKSLGVGDFGERFLVKFQTAEGHDLTWFTGPCEFEQGTAYDITATVKDHQEYQKRRGTVVQRVVQGLPKPKGKKRVAKTAE